MRKTKSRKKPAERIVPNLVVEFHYDDGDVGAHPASELEARLWQHFARKNSSHNRSHIIIRRDTPEAQTLSDELHKASIEHLKAIYLRKIADAENMLNKLEVAR